MLLDGENGYLKSFGDEGSFLQWYLTLVLCILSMVRSMIGSKAMVVDAELVIWKMRFIKLFDEVSEPVIKPATSQTEASLLLQRLQT